MEIITYDKKYQQQLTDLIVGIQTDEFGVNITLADQPDLANIPDFYQKDGGNFWLAIDQGQVVGTIALIRLKDGNSALRKMFVNKKYRGKAQVGQKLLDVLLDYCKTEDIHYVYLGTIDIFKAALGFYKKNQFVALPLTDFPKDYPVVAVDNVFLMREI